MTLMGLSVGYFNSMNELGGCVYRRLARYPVASSEGCFRPSHHGTCRTLSRARAERHENALEKWLSNADVQYHNRLFFEAHRKWRAVHHICKPQPGYLSLRYVLLHSFAHALIRQLTLECGYTTASIRERIYSLPSNEGDGPMAGILLYTSAPDSEGTLGGLVSLGQPEQFGRHIDGALEQMQSCASDPLCAEHSSRHEHTLHEAACHACLFIPETSCERGNKYLDRSVLVSTVAREQLAFFNEL